MKRYQLSIATLIYAKGTLAFNCDVKNIQGRYAMTLTGTGITQSPPSIIPFIGPVAGIGVASLNEDASLELIEHLNGAGQIFENIKLKGKFSIEKNCTGNAIAINTFNNKEHKYKFVVANGGKKLFLMMTYPTSPILNAELTKIDSK